MIFSIILCMIFLLFLWSRYRKIKKHPEKYDNMEILYKYEPRFRYLEKESLEWRNLINSYCHASIVPIIISCIGAVPVSLLYYRIKKSFIPAGSVILGRDDFSVALIYACAVVVILYALFCLFCYSKSGFLQTVAFAGVLDGKSFRKSVAMRRRILGLMGITIIAIPAFYLSIHDYMYATDEMIIRNTFFQLNEETYAMEECKGVILQYRKSGKEGKKVLKSLRSFMLLAQAENN